MKKLEIKTNKRLLIVEGGFMYYHNGSPLKYICKGSDLTEDIAKGLVEEIYHTSVSFYKDYNSEKPNEIGFHCEIKSFISAIEAAGYHWGENPRGETAPACFEKDTLEVQLWHEAESMTFNPSKCIIFEIA